MSWRIGIGRLLAAAAAVGLASCAVAPPTTSDRSEPVQILVTVAQSESSAFNLVGNPDNRYIRRRDYGSSPSTERTLSQIERDHDLRRAGGWPIASLGVYCEIYEITDGRTVDDVLAALSSDARVELAQPMNEFVTQSAHYNDPLSRLQTAVSELSVDTAHASATGRGITVAVIDSQVQLNHPDLRGRIDFSRDLLRKRAAPPRAEVHGTAVAGVIASRVNNTEGIVGIAPDADVIALRACQSVERGSSAARCTSFSVASALELAIDLEADVINLSFAGPEDPLLASLLDVAIERGAIVVASLPQVSGDNNHFPASHAGVIAADDGASAVPSHSLHVAAPAREVLTTVPDSDYAFLSGNSFAAAHVSGIAALLLERSPDIDAAGIVELMMESAGEPGGRVNACRAIARLDPTNACDETEALSVARARRSD